MKISDIMTTHIQTAEPDDTLDDIAIMMRDQDVGAIPVVEQDELIGIITDRDIVLRCIAEGKNPGEIAADEVISGDLQTIHPHADIEEARRIMSDNQIRRLPVVENGRLIGMVSLGDLAVKTNAEREVAETLEGISDGVKASDQSAARTSHGAKNAKTMKARNAQQRGPAQTRSTEGRQETLGRTGRQQRSIRGRIEEQSQGNVDRRQDVSDRAQGITSHAASQEVERQNRVVPIRSQQRTNVRGERRAKSGSRRKAS